MYKNIAASLSLAGVVLIGSTYAVEYGYKSGILDQVDVPVALSIRAQGYVFGTLGLCMLFCAPSSKKDEEFLEEYRNEQLNKSN